jgi:hypothetical protein
MKDELMQLSELSSILQVLPIWLVQMIGGALATLGLFLWIRARTGSTHILTTRLWRFLHGKHTMTSPVLQAFIQERDDLMLVRMVTGLKRIRTRAAAERLVDWLRGQDVDVDLVAAAGYHFDVNKPGFQRCPPSRTASVVLMLVSATLIYSGLIVGSLGTTLPPLIRVNASKIWYAVSDDRAYRFQMVSRATPAFNVSRCGDTSATATLTGYPAHDVSVICESMSTDDGKAERRKAHTSQVVLSIAIALTGLAWGGLLLQEMRRVESSHELYKHVEQRAEEWPADGG